MTRHHTSGNREQAFIAKTVQQEVGATLALASASAIERAVIYNPYDGKTLSQYFTALAESDSNRIISEVQQGLRGGQTESQIRRRIFGTKRLDYKDGILQATRNSVNNTRTNSGIVRTTITGVTNSARQELFLKNDVERYKYR